MGALIAVIIFGLVAFAGLLITLFGKDIRAIGAVVLAVGLVVSGAVIGFGSFTTNDEGQAKVLKSFTGEVEGSVTKAGINGKAFWQSAIDYGIRNQNVEFKGDDGANGPAITIQDKDKVSANIDISVRYSIDPKSVENIYKSYGSEQEFIKKFIERDIEAGLRTIPANYTTAEFLGERASVETDILTYLTERWEKAGVIAQSVSLQDIRYPEAVQKAFADAQTARIAAERAGAELEANKIKAESNRVLAESITPQTIEQMKYETLAKIGEQGNLVIVPEEFNGMINVGK